MKHPQITKNFIKDCLNINTFDIFKQHVALDSNYFRESFLTYTINPGRRTGKTSDIFEYIRENPEENFLYISFSDAVLKNTSEIFKPTPNVKLINQSSIDKEHVKRYPIIFVDNYSIVDKENIIELFKKLGKLDIKNFQKIFLIG